MTIEKISNLQILLTDEVINRKWNDVIVKRNKLLSISDWTQLSDAPINKEMRNMWTKWRQKVRQVKKSAIINSEKALELLNVLELQIPEKIQYVTETIVAPMVEEIESIPIIDVDVKLNELKDEIYKQIISMNDVSSIINDKFTNNNEILLKAVEHLIDIKLQKPVVITPPKEFLEDQELLIQQVNDKYRKEFSEYTEVDNEKFKQAVDYIVDKTPNEDHYPLLKIHFKMDAIDKVVVAQKLIADRNKWLQRVCKLEEDRLQYIKRIMDATISDHLDIIRTELEL